MEPQYPNIVFIMVDEWRAQSVGYMGDFNAHTPNIDALAQESTSFEQAISGHPVCCPARASLMTGQYPLRHGVYINDVELVPDSPTLAAVLDDAGFDTGYIGKWHLHGSPEGHFERREGFIPRENRCGFQYWKAGECTHDYNHSFYYANDDPTKRYWDGYDAIEQTEDAVGFIEDHENADQPYFLTLSYGPPHFPLHSAPERFRKMYENREIELRPNVPAGDRDRAESDLRGYYAHIAAIDECVGRLLEAVGNSNTIVVFTADHGDMLWSQGVDHKLTPWDESVRVPLLMRVPGRQPATSQQLFNSPDMMPTLLGLVGLKMPATVQGTDLSSPHSTGPSTAFLNVPVAFSSLRRCGMEEYRGVRDSRYTYVETVGGPWLLYDNVQDPYQLNNRVGDPSLTNMQTYLQEQLADWCQRLGDEFLPGDRYLEQDNLQHYFEVNEPLGYTDSPWGDWHSTNRRGRYFSIDTPIAHLVADPKALDVVQRHAPELLGDNNLWTTKHSPRIAFMAAPSLVSTGTISELDQALLNLGIRTEAYDRTRVDMSLPPKKRLTPLPAADRTAESVL